MKTWKMIKELTEDPNKKYKRVGEKRDLYVGVKNGRIVWMGDYVVKTGVKPFEVYTDLYWNEVKEPGTVASIKT